MNLQVLRDLLREHDAITAKHGDVERYVSTPDGTSEQHADAATMCREACAREWAEGRGTWRSILQEEVAEAFAETDKARLYQELIQVAAVATRWANALLIRS